MAINSMLPVPMYRQLKELLEEKIHKQKLAAHDKMPSEREMCASYNLSRTTVRQAIDTAVNEGLLYRVHGKGTFVAGPQVNQGLIRLISFEQTLLMRGFKPSMQVLDIEFLPGDIEKNTLLGLDAQAEIVRAEVLGLADGIPMAFFTYYLSAVYAVDAIEELKEYATRGKWFSFARYYKNKLHLNLGIARQTFEAQVAKEKISKLLKISQGSPVFYLTSIMYTADGQPVELRKSYYRGDRYKFNVDRQIVVS